MELTAESLQQVKFGAKVRGYDPEEVDRFIVSVTEVGEELHERLRRATERAVNAEQQLAAISANPPPAPAPQPSAASQDLGRVWERAALAAEAAIEEARVEADRILTEARRTADEAVGSAREEARRLVEETEGQLRADIARLEAARDQLKRDVDGLHGYLSDEKSRLRDSIIKALSDIDEYGSVPDSPPSVSSVDVPVQQTPPPVAPSNDFSSFKAPEPVVSDQRGFGSEPTSTSSSQPSFTDAGYDSPVNGDTGEQSWVADPPIDAPAAPTPAPVAATTEEDEGDPFLAELRRAVRDDGPLGPRDDGSNEEDSIDRLYADDDDDKSFFKRKK